MPAANDPRFVDLYDAIYSYEAIPTAPSTHPVLRSSEDLSRDELQPSKSFQKPKGFSVKTDGRSSGGLLGDADGVYFTWEFPAFDQSVYEASGIDLGVGILTPATIAYEFRVLEGSFSDNEINTRAVFGFNSSGTESQQVFPGPIVYESFVNIADPDLPIYLNKSSEGRVDIPDGIFESGTDYTAIVRHLFWSRTFTEEVDFDHVFSHYSVLRFRTSAVPVISNLRVNDKVDAVVGSTEDIRFSFSVSDADGPDILYRLQVFNAEYNTESAIFDTGLVKIESTGLTTTDISVPYMWTRPSSGTYKWVVSVSDGISSQSAVTDGEDTFEVNAPPVVESLKANDEELIYGESPIIDGGAVEISWELAEGDEQRGYRLRLFSNGEVFLDTGTVISEDTSFVVPELPDDQDVEVELVVRDTVENSLPARGEFKTNSSPRVTLLRVGGETNPTDLSSSTPTFSWTFTDNNPSDMQSSFQIQVARDEDFSDLVWDTDVVTSAATSVVYGSTASPVVAPESLISGTMYYFRVAVSDGLSYSSFSSGFFAINTAPGNPMLVLPTSGAYEDELVIQWVAASPEDADGDDVSYTIELTNQSTFERGWRYLVGPFASGTTSYTLDLSDIPSGSNYAVRVIASDGLAESDPSSGGTSPTFSVLNHAPTSPVFVSPEDAYVANKSVKAEWVEANIVDVDGDTVFYELDVSSNSSEDNPLWESVQVFEEGASKFFLDVSGYADGDDFRFRIRAVDSAGKVGEYSYSGTFSVSNKTAASDMEILNGTLYVGTNDGRILRSVDSIWQLDEDWSGPDYGKFEVFERGTPNAVVEGGKLKISPAPGSTFILRQSDE